MNEILETADRSVFDVQTSADGPSGSLPLTDEMLRRWPSGHLFGMTQNAGMGWDPREMLGPQVLVQSTQGGVRAPDGSPVALGFHTGHWEVGLLVARGRLALSMPPKAWFDAFLAQPGAELAPMPVDTLIESSFLPGAPPRDPADRIVLATARATGMKILTRDRAMLNYAGQGHAWAVEC